MAKKQRDEWFSRLMKRVKKHGPSSGIILAAAIFLVLLAWLCSLSWKTEGGDWAVKGLEDLRNVFLIVAGCVGGGFVYWRTSIASTDAETKKQNGINNMYTNAIEQLGKEHEKGRPNLEVRIGALYSLEKLAKANEGYRQSIMDVLCSYVRNNAPLPKDQEKPEEHEYASQYTDKPRTDIQTALTIIGRSNTEAADKVLPIDLSSCYLSGADLPDANLQRANLQRVNFIRANLMHVNLERSALRGADFRDANLFRVDLGHADLFEVNLQGADLELAKLNGVNLDGANLQEVRLFAASLQGANLERVNLDRANLQEANLRYANLEHVGFQGVSLLGVNLQDANLEGADLRACKALKCEQLRKAKNWQQAYRDKELACEAEIPNL